MKNKQLEGIDRFIAHLFGREHNPERPTQNLQVLIGFLRKWLRRFFLTFVIGATIFLCVVDWVGERNLFTTAFLFFPPQIWFVPLFGFGGAAVLLFDWRLVIGVVTASFAFVWFYLDVEIGGGRPPDGGDQITVMTFNRGQSSGSLAPFTLLEKPDVIALQEARKRGKKYLRVDAYSDLTDSAEMGEFLILSRFPITDKGLVSFTIDGRNHDIAAWFVLNFAGREIVVYNVHLDTPRERLNAFKRGAFLHGLLPFTGRAKAHQKFWDRQISLAERLKDHIGRETRPTIVVGDFNTPDHGYIYRKFASELQDAHEQCGSGFGWTFPGKTRNPLSLFGPWLRIDHQFADEHWRVLLSKAESRRPSQHLAVVGRYELAK